MAKTYVDMFKPGAEVTVTFTSEDVVKLQAILFRHMSKKSQLDDESWTTILDLCSKIEDCAKSQDKMESKEIKF